MITYGHIFKDISFKFTSFTRRYERKTRLKVNVLFHLTMENSSTIVPYTYTYTLRGVQSS